MTTKFIFLTGGAKRIGKTTCKHFHDQGFNVIFHYNSSESEAYEIQNSLNDIRENSCFILQADFNDKSSIEKLSEGVSKITEELAVLINNASSFYPTPLQDASMDEWNDLMATNATTPLFLTKVLLPFLRNGKGSVINISDTLAPSGIKNFRFADPIYHENLFYLADKYISKSVFFSKSDLFDNNNLLSCSEFLDPPGSLSLM